MAWRVVWPLRDEVEGWNCLGLRWFVTTGVGTWKHINGEVFSW